MYFFASKLIGISLAFANKSLAFDYYYLILIFYLNCSLKCLASYKINLFLNSERLDFEWSQWSLFNLQDERRL